MNDLLQHFPVDIVIFAGIALGLAWRLRSVLGRRGGAQPVVAYRNLAVNARPARNAAQTPVRPDAPGATLDVPTPGTRIGKILAEMTAVDRHFDPASFLREAEATFRMVVTAFAAGDRAALQRFLTTSAYGAFDAAITARAAEGQSQRAEIRAVLSLSIEDAQILPATVDRRLPEATIAVRIVSQQISVVTDKAGQVVSGTDATTEFSDLWRFERLCGPQAPETRWRLGHAQAG